MAQSGYTPLLLYGSSTPSAVPLAANLTSSAAGAELALNYADGKLFYKDSGGVVQVLATKATGTIGGSNTQVQYNNAGALAGSANLTFNGTTLTANTLNLTNPLTTAHGGTGLSSYTAGDLVYYAAGTALTKLGIGASTTILTSTGTAPQWSTAASITVGTATNLAGGVAGSVPYQTGAGATTFLGIGSSTFILTSTGSAPQWSNPTGVTVGTATNAVNTGITANSTNATNYLTFVSNTTGNLPQLVNSGISCNPSTGSITGGISAGTF